MMVTETFGVMEMTMNGHDDDVFDRLAEQSRDEYYQDVMNTKLEEVKNQLLIATGALLEINSTEMNSMRPGGSPSPAAKLSFDALKRLGIKR
jgi:hypothetical protein